MTWTIPVRMQLPYSIFQRDWDVNASCAASARAFSFISSYGDVLAERRYVTLGSYATTSFRSFAAASLRSINLPPTLMIFGRVDLAMRLPL